MNDTKNHNNISYEQILKLAINAGQIMLESGAEAYRIEDTMINMMKKLSDMPCSAYATITGLTACIEAPGETKTLLRRVAARDTNLNNIHVINQISRDLVNDIIDYDEALARVEQIKNNRSYSSFNIKALALFLMAASFTLLLSGSAVDVLVSMIISSTTIFIYFINKKIKMRSIITCFLSALLVTLGARLLQTYIFTSANYNLIIAANLMPLFPGTAVTNAIRDTITGDYVSASARGIEAVVTATSLAIGTGLALLLSGVITSWVW